MGCELQKKLTEGSIMNFSFHISVQLRIYFPDGLCALWYLSLNVIIQWLKHSKKVSGVKVKAKAKNKTSIQAPHTQMFRFIVLHQIVCHSLGVFSETLSIFFKWHMCVCASKTIDVTRCHYYTGFFFMCKQMASLGKIYHIFSSCSSVWYRAIKVSTEDSTSAGLALCFSMVSCMSFITGEWETRWDEVFAKRGLPQIQLQHLCSEINKNKHE